MPQFLIKSVLINAFHKNKRPINIDKVDIKKIVLSKKDSCCKKGSFKYFIGYMH